MKLLLAEYGAELTAYTRNTSSFNELQIQLTIAGGEPFLLQRVETLETEKLAAGGETKRAEWEEMKMYFGNEFECLYGLTNIRSYFMRHGGISHESDLARYLK
ncbi:MAG: hypothetical protein ACKVTZ_06070 [Bacteroidia bacterium]